jgi:RimJ/RimL family protein N-acetyltransferase
MRRGFCVAEFRIETKRLILRDWQECDLEPFHAISTDPVVMATLGPLMTRDQVAALIARMHRYQVELGHTAWAIERKLDSALIGWCGLIPGAQGTPIENKTDIGWRLASAVWGNGYAMTWGFENLPDDSIWAITSTGNFRSRAVMERLQMRHDPLFDFDHPNVPVDSPLLRHVTYRIGREEFNQDRWAG